MNEIILNANSSSDKISDNVQITVGESFSGNSKKKKKRQNKVFTKEQLNLLEKAFAENHYLTRTGYLHLSKTLNVSKRRIKIWFGNRRVKRKKNSQQILGPIKYTAVAAAAINCMPTTLEDGANRHDHCSSVSSDSVSSDSVSSCTCGSRKIRAHARQPPFFVGQPPVRSPWTPGPQPHHLPHLTHGFHAVGSGSQPSSKPAAALALAPSDGVASGSLGAAASYYPHVGGSQGAAVALAPYSDVASGSLGAAAAYYPLFGGPQGAATALAPSDGVASGSQGATAAFYPHVGGPQGAAAAIAPYNGVESGLLGAAPAYYPFVGGPQDVTAAYEIFMPLFAAMTGHPYVNSMPPFDFNNMF